MALTGHAADDTPSVGRYAAFRPQYAIRRETLVDIVLHGAAYLCLFRATQMWVFYPSTQNENATVEPATQQMLLYSLIPLVALYALLAPKRFLAALKRVPIAVMVLAAFIVLAIPFSQSVMASVRGVMAVVVISAPILLFKQHYGSVATYKLLRNFAAFAVLANLAYTAVMPGYGIMGGSLAGSMRGMFMHKNLFGQFSAISFILLIPPLAAFRPLRWSTLFLGFCAVLALGCAALSLSSTALLLVVVGTATLVTVTLMRVVPGRALRGYFYVVALTLLVIGSYTIGLFVAETIAGGVGKDLTLSGRTELWEALVPAIFQHPFAGHGFAMFRQTEYLQTFTSHIPWGPRSTHNSYIEMALNMGLPVAALFVAYALAVLAKKATSLPPNPALRVVRAREVVVMLLVMIGSLTEAGLLFAPLITWVLLLAVIGSPEDRLARRTFVTRPARR